MHRVVFDTNVLLSAFLFGGNPRELLEQAREHRLALVTSPSILLEFSRILKGKFSWEDNDIADAVKAVGFCSEVVKPTQTLKVISDDADNRILECAVECNADYIASGDHHLLEIGEYKGIRLMNPKELMDLLAELPE